MAEPALLKPDKAFIDQVVGSGGESLKHCYQCATCSVVCELAPDRRPFPRKEMIWSQWGLKDRLLADPDVWLCYQCNDCSKHCPRGARPGDVMGALRREAVVHYGVPGFLGRWVSDLRFAPLLLAVPAVLLGLAILLKAPIEEALGIAGETGRKIVYAYSPWLPHWILIPLFGIVTLFALLVLVIGVGRFWKAMKAADAKAGTGTPVLSFGASLGAALGTAVRHSDFPTCDTERPRYLSHMLVFFGFLALGVVPIWVISGSVFNPLIRDPFVYPFNFWNPWRILANLGGAAVAGGCVLMIRDRLNEEKNVGAGSYFDWAFLLTVLGVVLTGFAAEFLHYARVEPHRHFVYFGHLVLVFALLAYLPYSKFAHLAYRTTAMVYAAHTGRTGTATAAAPAPAETVSAPPSEGEPKKEEEKKTES
jgi:quinone-modifying oxidoreductase subunit QmoC